jgi:CHAT domain-containing protein
LIVADPTLDVAAFNALHRLPAAAEEVRQITASYRDAHVLTDAAATRSAVIQSIQGRPIVHFATHAIVNDRDPSESCLVLAPEHGSSGAFYLRDIATLDLHHTYLVVLAGCRTGVQSTSGHGDVRNLATAFTLAGAANVVATSWDVDDEPTAQFSAAVHLNVARGMSVAAAVRDAQLAMLRSSDGQPKALRSWSGMEVFSVRQ